MQKPLEELKERMTDTEILYVYGYPVAGKDQSRFEEALQAVREADVVILTLGESTVHALWRPWEKV